MRGLETSRVLCEKDPGRAEEKPNRGKEDLGLNRQYKGLTVQKKDRISGMRARRYKKRNREQRNV